MVRKLNVCGIVPRRSAWAQQEIQTVTPMSWLGTSHLATSGARSRTRAIRTVNMYRLTRVAGGILISEIFF